MDGDIPVHALLISLQGLANRDQPRLYLEYPTHWQWEIVRPLETFLEKRHGSEVRPPRRERCRRRPRPYAEIRQGRRRLGQGRALLPHRRLHHRRRGGPRRRHADQLPLAAKHGLKPVVDLRGKFTGQTDAQIYQWAYDRYFEPLLARLLRRDGRPRRRRDAAGRRRLRHPPARLLHRPLGQPEAPRGTRPAQKNPRPARTSGEHRPRLAFLRQGHRGPAHHSSPATYGLKMEGLHNLPNVSFTCQFRSPRTSSSPTTTTSPATRSSRRRRRFTSPPCHRQHGHRHLDQARPRQDALRLAGHDELGKFSPAALQYFYESKSPNDYFIGGLSGPGYMYPNPSPPTSSPALMKEARELMASSTSTSSRSWTTPRADRHVGNADLTKEVVDRYYAAFPDVIGFINGYGPARTRDLRDTRPMLSELRLLHRSRRRPAPRWPPTSTSSSRSTPQAPLLPPHPRPRVQRRQQVIEVLKQLDGPSRSCPSMSSSSSPRASQTYTTRYQDPARQLNHDRKQPSSPAP
jgi:hypothetical protein